MTFRDQYGVSIRRNYKTELNPKPYEAIRVDAFIGKVVVSFEVIYRKKLVVLDIL